MTEDYVIGREAQEHTISGWRERVQCELNVAQKGGAQGRSPTFVVSHILAAIFAFWSFLGDHCATYWRLSCLQCQTGTLSKGMIIPC